jgi:XapX domain-containing protein
MRVYLPSLGAGLLVRVVYSLLNVGSPAPPLVALIGALGIPLGEQIVPVAKHMRDGSHLAAAWREAKCAPHTFGMLSGRHADVTSSTTNVGEKVL